MAMTISIQLFEALTDIGVKPEKAHAVEKQFEAAIEQATKQHVEVRLINLATKSDLTELTWKLIGVMIAGNALLFTALKFFVR